MRDVNTPSRLNKSSPSLARTTSKPASAHAPAPAKKPALAPAPAPAPAKKPAPAPAPAKKPTRRPAPVKKSKSANGPVLTSRIGEFVCTYPTDLQAEYELTFRSMLKDNPTMIMPPILDVPAIAPGNKMRQSLEAEVNQISDEIPLDAVDDVVVVTPPASVKTEDLGGGIEIL